MSIDDARTFREQINRSKELQKEVEQILRKEAEPGIVRLAERHGLHFTTEDIFAVLASSELTDFELEMVGGGTAVSNQNCSTVQSQSPVVEQGVPIDAQTLNVRKTLGTL